MIYIVTHNGEKVRTFRFKREADKFIAEKTVSDRKRYYIRKVAR